MMMSDSFICLMYHNLLPCGGAGRDADALSPSITSYFVDERAFVAQLQMLAESVDVMSHDDVARFYEGQPAETTSSRPRVHLTFDDGWKGCVELGAPLLESRGWQATLFVTTELIGRPQFVSESDLRAVAGKAFHIGSHARTHCFLNELADPAIQEELKSSKQRLEDILGRPVDSVSIPNGAVDDRVRDIAAQLGYRLVFTSSAHANSRATCPLNVGRIAVRSSTTSAQVAAFARGQFGRERLRQGVLSLPKRVLGPKNYRTLRRTLLGEGRRQSEMHDLM